MNALLPLPDPAAEQEELRLAEERERHELFFLLLEAEEIKQRVELEWEPPPSRPKVQCLVESVSYG